MAGNDLTVCKAKKTSKACQVGKIQRYARNKRPSRNTVLKTEIFI